ncbi:hypothetical protein LX13_004524 [Williamsia maris]|uniref:Uncharacterized protein n=1 Tax=Williamsia maris TaxID=72806 RepID=A0ABT1HL80_9NOCA|nr:hypothetical protein [Williamsia maris]
MSQDEQRFRRRKHLLITYDGRFDLAAEVAALTEPMARRVAGEPHPLSYLHRVEDIVAAVHGAIATISMLLVERDARRRTAHVPDSNRAQAMRAVVALAPRPVEPEVTNDDVLSGAWAAVLTEYARRYAQPLSDYLAHARQPGDIDPAISVSGRVEAALREIDAAANDLHRVLKRAASLRAEASFTPLKQVIAEQHRATLADLGVEVEP